MEAKLERAKGIEPSASAWEAEVLPLYDARFELLEGDGSIAECAF